MKKIPQYIIDKAIELRVKHKMTVPEIAECLGYSKSTVNGWMEAYPLEERTAKQGNAQIAAAKANRENAAKKRQAAYDEGFLQASQLLQNRQLRDFVCMYIGEGTKRNRNGVEIANSNSKVIQLGHRFIRMFMNEDNKITYSVQIHADHDEEEIKIHWAKLLEIDPNIIVIKRKSNSGQLAGRKFNSKHGVFSILANDTYFRSRLEAWMDYVFKDWDYPIEDCLDIPNEQ